MAHPPHDGAPSRGDSRPPRGTAVRRRRTRRLTRIAAPLLALLLGSTSCGLVGELTEEQWEVAVTVGALSPGPLAPREDHSLVWSGSEVLVWGGHADGQFDSFSDGAAYSPGNDTWRPLADSGLEPRSGHSAVMVEGRMLVWGGFTPTFEDERDGHMARDGAFYDPERDVWEPIAPAPESRSLARGVVADGHVVFGGGYGEQGDGEGGEEGFLVYSPEEDAWHTAPLRRDAEHSTVYDLVALDGTVVAVGGSREGMFLATLHVGGETASVQDFSGLTDAEEDNLHVGLAVSSEGRALLALRGGESVSLYEFGPTGAELVDEVNRADFGPPVPEFALGTGEMGLVEGLGLLATGTGEISLWDVGAGRARRFQTEALSGHCGPLVPVAEDALVGWGGLGCEPAGVRVDVSVPEPGEPSAS
ncbi:kelch repeat-containing protein [Nocardiopsis dassonvillei]|uniref:Kelch repeat-containing protein n=1 Tax=Nocardiopsis dassonvillei TaxID=2014 RepID=UPI00102BFA5D|nr:kelch repeat-containing protein [Nocardiopsis dassonvillei]MCP3016969.1 kelch repeat-containing protein [Nocardiopsis dassonvillei]